MYNFPSEAVVKSLRESYPEGTRIALVSMDDPYSKLNPGDRGTVLHVDDAGTIHVRWDCGSGLGIAYGEDSCRKLTEAELTAEQKSSLDSQIKAAAGRVTESQAVSKEKIIEQKR